MILVTPSCWTENTCYIIHDTAESRPHRKGYGQCVQERRLVWSAVSWIFDNLKMLGVVSVSSVTIQYNFIAKC